MNQVASIRTDNVDSDDLLTFASDEHFQETLEEIRSLGDAIHQQSILFVYGATLAYEDHLEDGIALLQDDPHKQEWHHKQKGSS